MLEIKGKKMRIKNCSNCKNKFINEIPYTGKHLACKYLFYKAIIQEHVETKYLKIENTFYCNKYQGVNNEF